MTKTTLLALALFTLPAVWAHPRVCPKGRVSYGTDLSDNDGQVNLAAARAGGLSFVFIKATEGITAVDPVFATEWAAAKAQGLKRGAYHYFHPEDDPLLSALQFLKTLAKDYDVNDLPPVLDFETLNGVSVSLARTRALTWLSVVRKATGRTPMIYVSPAFWDKVGRPAEFAAFPLFVADYGVACPTVPPPWTTWTFWQSGVGTVPGIGVPADQDLFNGASSALNGLK